MREFRFLEEKRHGGRLTAGEEQRWNELRRALGQSEPTPEPAPEPATPTPEQETYAQGYYGKDGNWYAFEDPQWADQQYPGWVWDPTTEQWVQQAESTWAAEGENAEPWESAWPASPVDDPDAEVLEVDSDDVLFADDEGGSGADAAIRGVVTQLAPFTAVEPLLTGGARPALAADVTAFDETAGATDAGAYGYEAGAYEGDYSPEAGETYDQPGAFEQPPAYADYEPPAEPVEAYAQPSDDAAGHEAAPAVVPVAATAATSTFAIPFPRPFEFVDAVPEPPPAPANFEVESVPLAQLANEEPRAEGIEMALEGDPSEAVPLAASAEFLTMPELLSTGVQSWSTPVEPVAPAEPAAEHEIEVVVEAQEPEPEPEPAPEPEPEPVREPEPEPETEPEPVREPEPEPEPEIVLTPEEMVVSDDIEALSLEPAPAPPPPTPLVPPVIAASAGPKPPVVPIPLLTPVKEASPPPAPSSRVEGEHRVVVHTIEGQVLRGLIRNADLLAKEIALEQAGGAAPERVPVARLKAVFFMLPAGARPPQATGQQVKITFNDGRQIAGFSSAHASGDPGFFVIPADSRTNTARIFIYRGSVQTVEG